MRKIRQMMASLQSGRKAVGLELPADEVPVCAVETSMSVPAKRGDKKIQIADDNKLFPIRYLICIGTMQQMEERIVIGHMMLVLVCSWWLTLEAMTPVRKNLTTTTLRKTAQFPLH
jgi:hypothetical protein